MEAGVVPSVSSNLYALISIECWTVRNMSLQQADERETLTTGMQRETRCT